MKRLLNRSLATVVLALLAIVMLTGCEPEDEQVARTLEGNWSGTMADYYYNRWGDYLQGNRYYTYFQFVRQSAVSGNGTEVDEDERGDYVEREFTWRVESDYSDWDYNYSYGSSGGYFTIYLRYDSRYFYYDAYRRVGEWVPTGAYDAVIYNAHLDNRYFEGYMDDSDGARKYFRLQYESNPWVWGD